MYLIQNEELSQYSEDLEERMFIQNEPYIIHEYMRTLYVLNSENTEAIALQLIEFADNFPNMDPPDDPLRSKVLATKILFEADNYSTANYAFNILERDFPKVNPDAFDVIVDALIKVPSLEEIAKIELLRIINNSPNSFQRFYSIKVLKEAYSSEMIEYLAEWFQSDDDYFTVRIRCLKYLSELNYANLNSLLKSRLSQDPNWSLRLIISDTLLSRFGEPSDLKEVIDYQPNEPNETARSLMAHTIYNFIPPRPTISTSEMTDILISYTQELFQYGWITDQVTSEKYTAYFNTTKDQIIQGDSSEARSTLEAVLEEVETDKDVTITNEAYVFLRYDTEYIVERLPIGGENISTYSVFATHSIWLKQNSDILSGSVGVNEIGEGPFLDSQLELSVGKSTTTSSGYTIKGNRIKVKQSATVNADVYYNELTNNGTITGELFTPLELPLLTTLPEFHTSTPGTEDIVVPQNGEYTLLPGAYGEIQVKKNGKLTFTGGEYHINDFNGGINNQLLFQGESDVRINDKFETGQGSYIGPEDTTTLSAKDIVFYVEGINGNNGNIGATPKAAKLGLNNTVFANFYVPNGTLLLRQNSEVEGAFIGKDVIVGLSVQVKLNSAF